MAASLQLLSSDAVTPFVTLNYGNIIAGNNSVESLFFVHANGDAIAPSSEFGFLQVPGNDGYTFSEVCLALLMNATGVTVNAVAADTGGSIPPSTTLNYKITAVDRWGWESEMGDLVGTVTTGSGTSTNKVTISWTAIPGADQYGVYLDDGSGYKLLDYTSLTSLDDLTGIPTSQDPPLTGSKAYKSGSWSRSPLSLGSLNPGDMIPVMLHEVIPGGTSSTGNPRNHDLYVSFLII